jgi:hypothetical protein
MPDERTAQHLIALLMVIACVLLLPVVVICGLLGFGNLLTGGHRYVSMDLALVLALISVGAFAGEFLMVLYVVRVIHRSD